VRLYRYFDILVERCQHPHQLFHRNQLKLTPKQLGQVRLFHLDQLGSLGLRDFALRYQLLELDDESGLELMLLGIGQPRSAKMLPEPWLWAGSFFLVLIIGLPLSALWIALGVATADE
jgi:hypothetical protein